MDTVESLMIYIYHHSKIIKGTTVSHNKLLCKYIILITAHHAEYKAIIGGPSVRGCTLYVTKYPCDMCAKVVVQAGITKVVYYEEGGREDEKYISSRKTLRTCLGIENITSIRLVLKQHVYAITVSLIEVIGNSSKMGQVH